MSDDDKQIEVTGPFFVVSRGGNCSAGSGWGMYQDLDSARERRQSLRQQGVDAVITVQFDEP